ncbi:MAG: carboxymuconolactone decarboxylase family protein [Alphaproteobacteria bacterium]
MTRIPVLEREDMDAKQQAAYDKVVANNARVGFGPAIGYAYSADVWRLHNESSAHLLDCSLTNTQVRIISLMTVRHWKAAYPWSAQAKTALKAGLDPDIIEAINEGRQPDFDNDEDAAIHAATRELLETGNLSEDGFAAAEKTLGYQRIVELVAAIGHFCTTGLMANVVGVTPDPEAPSHLKL